ncbi:histidine phosphatase family protein [Cupriavidus pauculus]|jgi:phosphohistidine phosphatase|uniref:Histidine phosphatase family protein n=1 Tax=Cupriavidus pauculus TaxID=82633 RepID=A0A5P2H090_9BURK|nr:histidine phosphatase family protein [Cupriavidus pauculus]QET01198.1 histidine phosphatase family protein [Cupriavidus pauculus]
MNLILWRHAEAEDLPSAMSLSRNADLQRVLTPRGHKQAEATAKWLRNHLPAPYRVVCSPAVRARETAAALCSDAEVLDVLGLGASVTEVLATVGWPGTDDAATQTVVVVGHQPWLGRVASRVLAGREMPWSVRKSGVWWLTGRTRDSDAQVALRAVIHPDFL